MFELELRKQTKACTLLRVPFVKCLKVTPKYGFPIALKERQFDYQCRKSGLQFLPIRTWYRMTNNSGWSS